MDPTNPKKTFSLSFPRLTAFGPLQALRELRLWHFSKMQHCPGSPSSMAGSIDGRRALRLAQHSCPS